MPVNEMLTTLAAATAAALPTRKARVL